MKEHREPRGATSRGLTRRAVLQGAAAAATAVAVPRAVSGELTEAAYVPRPGATPYTFHIAAASLDPDATQLVPAVLVNGSLPGTEVRVREGEQLRILVENRLADSPTSIHWHGLLDPAAMDGVPDISNVPIAPGRMYVYEYPIRQSGTYWYHSHFGFQEQRDATAASSSSPRTSRCAPSTMPSSCFGDWLHRNPDEVFARAARRESSRPGGRSRRTTAATAPWRWAAAAA